MKRYFKTLHNKGFLIQQNLGLYTALVLNLLCFSLHIKWCNYSANLNFYGSFQRFNMYKNTSVLCFQTIVVGNFTGRIELFPGKFFFSM